MPPKVVPMASAISGFSISGRFPSSSRKPATWETPVSVPAVSKKSTKKNVKTISAKLNASTFWKPTRNAPTRGEMSYCAAGSWAGASTPGSTAPAAVTAQPTIVVMRMPRMIDPRTPRA